MKTRSSVSFASTFVFIAFLLCIPNKAWSNEAVSGPPISLTLCSPSNSSLDLKSSSWVKILAIAVMRQRAVLERNGISIGVDTSIRCPGEVGESCFTQGRQMFCSLDALIRPIVAAGVLSISSAREALSRKRIVIGTTIGSDKAFEIADFIFKDNSLFPNRGLLDMSTRSSIISYAGDLLLLAETLEHSEINGAVPNLGNPLIVFSAGYFESTIGYILSYLLGHELGHTERGCPYKTLSHSEVSGDLIRLVTEQSSGGKICYKELMQSEVSAEACSLRSLRSYGEAILAEKMATSRNMNGLMPAIDAVSRQNAIALLHSMLLLKLDWHSGKSIGTVMHPLGGDVGVAEISFEEGYIYAPIRTLLVAEELRSGSEYSKSIGVCGPTASSLAMNLPITAEWCRIGEHQQDGTRRLSAATFLTMQALFGKFMPRGVSEFWLSAGVKPVVSETFNCSTNFGR